MKKSVLLVLVVALGLVSCNKNDVFPAQDAERAVVARTPSNNSSYSDYIISEQEAVALVEKDLQSSGGEFAKKQIASVEPILFAEIKFALENFKKMQDLGLIKLTDPAIYLVHFINGGFAIVFPDKDFGVMTVHAQTAGEISGTDIANSSGSPVNPIPDPIPVDYKGDGQPDSHYWWTDDDLSSAICDWILNDWNRRQKETNLDEGFSTSNSRLQPKGQWGSGDTTPKDHWTEWKVVKNNEIATPYFVTTGTLNSYQAGTVLETVTSALIGFLGYFESPNALFGQTGNWNLIKGNEGTAPAPFWAYNISQYCNLQSINIGGHNVYYNREYFPYAKYFLLNECGGQYSNADIYQLSYDMHHTANDKLSQLIAGQKPVIVNFCGETGLAYREEFLEQHLIVNAYFVAETRFDSRIYYKVGTEKPNPTQYITRRSALVKNGMYYIAY